MLDQVDAIIQRVWKRTAIGERIYAGKDLNLSKLSLELGQQFRLNSPARSAGKMESSVKHSDLASSTWRNEQG